MRLTKAQQAEVIETMQKYGTAYRQKDIRALSALFSPGISGFGSGPDEVITHQQTFRPDSAFFRIIASGELGSEGNEVQRGAIRARIISGEKHPPGPLLVYLDSRKKKICARGIAGNGQAKRICRSRHGYPFGLNGIRVYAMSWCHGVSAGCPGGLNNS